MPLPREAISRARAFARARGFGSEAGAPTWRRCSGSPQFLLGVLGYLHTLNPPVVHRDIKPDNVIRGEDGRLWVVDFGAVRDFSTTMGGGSTVVGTYGYMAPEQFRGQAIPASDIYAVAATMLHLMTGRSPHELPQEKLKVVFRPMVQAPPPSLHGSIAPSSPLRRIASPRRRLRSTRYAAVSFRRPRMRSRSRRRRHVRASPSCSASSS